MYTAALQNKTFQSGFFEVGELVWAAQDPDPPDRFHTYTVCSGNAGLFASGKHDLIIQVFKVQGHRMGIRAIGAGARDVVVRNNEITNEQSGHLRGSG